MSDIMLTTPEQLRRFQLLQHIYALKIEVETGLRHSRGSVLRSAQQKYGVKSRTKAGALAELQAMAASLDGSDDERQGAR